MPPKAKDPNGSPAAEKKAKDATEDGIENYELPRALVTRIAKSSIPENAKMQKETVTALMKGSTVFINYLAATAHDIASSRQHKTVNATDVLKALEVLQFGDVVEPLQNELEVFRENVKAGKKATSARSVPSKLKGKERASESEGTSVLSASVSASAAGTRETDQHEEDDEEQEEAENAYDDEIGSDDELVEEMEGEGDDDDDEEDVEMGENGDDVTSSALGGPKLSDDMDEDEDED